MIASAGGLFAVLDIHPTLDPLVVKRAYFAALHRNPPHLDPEGFRRIREAYEKLSRSDDLFAAYMGSRPGIDDALSSLEATIGHEIARVTQADTLRNRDATAKATVVDKLSRMALGEVEELFSVST